MKDLFLHFTSLDDFLRAKKWFDEFSDFGYYRSNNEFLCLYFEDENIDALEAELREELTDEGFESFYFSAE